MKKTLITVLTAAALIAPSAWGVTTKASFVDGPGLYGGGEFIGTVYDVDQDPDAALFTWNTFCLEYSNPIVFGTLYTFTMSDRAWAGGPDSGDPGNGAGDPISIGTAFLYEQFANGTLAGYSYGNLPQREIDARALQVAIWWLEDEVSIYNPISNPWLAYAASQLQMSVNDLKADNNGEYRVGVMSLWDPNSRNPDHQDVLIGLPDGGLTVMLLGMALSGLAVLRRKA